MGKPQTIAEAEEMLSMGGLDKEEKEFFEEERGESKENFREKKRAPS